MDRGDIVNQEKTTLFDIQEIDKNFIEKILREVSSALKERGYNPINQIVGYLISGDPGYISNYAGARNKIQEVDRSKIVEVLLREFQGNKK